MHCPCGNATDPIWRVLASSLGISSWTPLKPQHSNPNPNPLTNQLWCIDFLTLPTPIITPPRLCAFLESLMPLKNWCSIHARCSKSSLKHSIRFCGIIFPKFIAYRSSKVSSCPDCIFEIHQLWQSGFNRLYSNSCCNCWFEPEIKKIGQSSHKIFSNNIELSRVYYNSKCLYKKSLETYWRSHVALLKLLVIIIIIVMLCRQHGYPWPSLATFPYRSSPPAGLLGYILCPHIAAVCKFGLVVLLLLGHMWGSVVVHHLRARLCFSSSVRRVWLVWPV